MSDAKPPEVPENDQPKLFTLWDKYEEAAKHFNDLNMRWRLQAIGGLVALGTLAGYVVGEQSTVAARLRAMIMLGAMLTLGWIAIALLDLFYYNQLLYGAGAAIRELEDKTKDWPLPLTLSTKLDERVYRTGRWAPIVFYALALFPLLAIMWWANCAFQSLPEHQRALFTPTIASVDTPVVPAPKGAASTSP